MEKNTVQASLLIKNPNISITSVASFRNFIFVSAYGDKLLIYTIRKENGTTTVSEPRIYENYFGTKNSAEEMIVDSMHELLLCRTSKGVYCADINDLSKKTLLANTEKSTCMALKIDCSKLCIGVRKKTLVYSFQPGKTGYRFVSFIPSKETPRCIEFMGDSLIVGCKIAFYIQDVDSFSITKTIMTKCSKSSICYLSVASSTNPEMMLLDSDNTIRTFDKQGISTHSEEELIRITTQPLQLISLFPYLFVIVKNFVYVFNIVSLERIQRIPLDGKFHIVPFDTVGEASFLLHSLHNIYTLGLLSPNDQIDLLLNTVPPSFEQALAVAINHDLPEDIKESLHCRYGYYLFSQSLFDEAMNHFTKSHCDVHNVIQLFSELQLPSLVATPLIKNDFPLPTLSPVSRRRAYEAFVSYLLGKREEIVSSHPVTDLRSSLDSSSSIQQDLLSIIDTSLVFTWISLQAGDALKSFLLNRNFCNVQLVEERLVETIQTAVTEKSRVVFSFALLYLFEGKHQYKRAVEVILFQMQQYRSVSPERSQLLEILTHVLYGLDSSDESLVFKCSEKIYDEQPSLVIRCFIDEEGMIGHLNIYHVVKHLQQLAEKEESVYDRNKLAMEYLKVVVPHFSSFPVDDVDHNLSQVLVSLYIETINACQQTDLGSSLQSDLLTLLKTNTSYIPSTTLGLLPADSMLYERCTVLSKLHNHQEALHLLLYSLKDCEGAYTYCKEVYSGTDEKDKQVFQVMLEILLQPREGDDPELAKKYSEEALVLIDRYHSYLDAEVVLNLFPDSTPFHELFGYTSQAITELTEHMYNTRMKYNLLMSDYLENQHNVAITRQNGVEVNETSLCEKCGKPLGTAAIVWVSDTELYHYACCEVEGDDLLLKDKRTGMVERVPLSNSTI